MNIAFIYFNKSAPDILEFGLLLILLLLFLLGIERGIFHIRRKMTQLNAEHDESTLNELQNELNNNDSSKDSTNQ
jgi:hypothetical protein